MGFAFGFAEVVIGLQVLGLWDSTFGIWETIKGFACLGVVVGVVATIYSAFTGNFIPLMLCWLLVSFISFVICLVGGKWKKCFISATFFLVGLWGLNLASDYYYYKEAKKEFYAYFKNFHSDEIDGIANAIKERKSALETWKDGDEIEPFTFELLRYETPLSKEMGRKKVQVEIEGDRMQINGSTCVWFTIKYGNKKEFHTNKNQINTLLETLDKVKNDRKKHLI